MRFVLGLLFADGFGSTLSHLVNVAPDLLFRAAERPEMLLNLLDTDRLSFFPLECVVVLFHEDLHVMRFNGRPLK
jgi:hypothetical protein